jgi:hypothetical protein
VTACSLTQELDRHRQPCRSGVQAAYAHRAPRLLVGVLPRAGASPRAQHQQPCRGGLQASGPPRACSLAQELVRAHGISSLPRLCASGGSSPAGRRYAASIGGARRGKRPQGREPAGGADGQIAASHRSSIPVNTLPFLLKLSKVPFGGQ